MEVNYLDAEDTQFLDKITPFPEIEEQLNYIIDNNNFRRCQHPYLKLIDISDINKEYSAETATRFPRFEISVIDTKASIFDTIFQLTICHLNCDIVRNGMSVSNLLCGRFSKYFEHYGDGKHSVRLAMDMRTAARLMTYCLTVYGYKDISNLKINTILEFTSANQAKMSIPTAISVPIAFRNAFAKLKKMYPCFYDFLYLRIASRSDKNTNEAVRIHVYDYLCEPGEQEGTALEYEEHWENRYEIEKRLDYMNFDCFRSGKSDGIYYASICFVEADEEKPLRFFTDYFLFLNPDISVEDIVVSIDFSGCKAEEQEEDNSHPNCDKSDWLFSFYPDGTEDSPEKFNSLIAELEKLRQPMKEADEEETKMYRNLDDLDWYPMGSEIKAFISTPSSEAIHEAHSRLKGFGEKAYFYDTDKRLVMTMSKQYMSIQHGQESNIKTVCTFYLTPEKRQLFDNLYFGTRHQRHEYESSQEGVSELTVCLQKDTDLASHYITYWLTSIGYDPNDLHISIQ